MAKEGVKVAGSISISRSLGVVTVGTLTCFMPLLASFGASAGQSNGLVFDSSSPSARREYKPPDYIFAELRRVSPDGKYVAQLTIGDAEISYVTIYRNRPHAKRFVKADARSETFVDTHGCVWVPGHRHWLVVSTGGCDYGEGMLALWSGRKHARRLLHAKVPEGEGFDVRSVSPDGQILVYEHLGLNSPDPQYQRNTRLRLSLPRL